MTSATLPSSTGIVSAYTYDPSSGRTDRITAVQPPSPAAAISYTWDDNGNLVERGSDTFAWDYEDRMVEATVKSVTSTFAYRGDPSAEGRSRTVGMATTAFTWDPSGKGRGLPVVLDDGPSQEGYLYGAGLSAMKQSGNWSFPGKDYLADGLGSTMAIVDSDGDVSRDYQYDVYETPTGGTGSLANEFDFAGQQTDASTGLQYLRARYYDPATGTFLSREPLERAGGWMGNPFGYVGANPARYLDATGLVPVDSDGCRDNDTGCQRRVQAEAEGACAGLYFYTYTYCKDRSPFSDWTLIGEYTLNRLLDIAKFWQGGLEAMGEGQIREAEFAASIGPRMHACATDVVCSLAVGGALHLLAVVAALTTGPVGWGVFQSLGALWTAYSVKAQQDRPYGSQAVPDSCHVGGAC